MVQAILHSTGASMCNVCDIIIIAILFAIGALLIIFGVSVQKMSKFGDIWNYVKGGELWLVGLVLIAMAVLLLRW